MLQDWWTLVFYMTLQNFKHCIFKVDLLGPTSVPAMLVAGSSHWRLETLPSAALEVWTEEEEKKNGSIHKHHHGFFWFLTSH